MALSPINLVRLNDLRDTPCMVAPESVTLGVSYKKVGELIGATVDDYLCNRYQGLVYVITGEHGEMLGAISYRMTELSIKKASLGLIVPLSTPMDKIAAAVSEVVDILEFSSPAEVIEVFLEDDDLIKIFKDRRFKQIGSLGAYQWICRDL